MLLTYAAKFMFLLRIRVHFVCIPLELNIFFEYVLNSIDPDWLITILLTFIESKFWYQAITRWITHHIDIFLASVTRSRSRCAYFKILWKKTEKKMINVFYCVFKWWESQLCVSIWCLSRTNSNKKEQSAADSKHFSIFMNKLRPHLRTVNT